MVEQVVRAVLAVVAAAADIPAVVVVALKILVHILLVEEEDLIMRDPIRLILQVQGQGMVK